MSSVLAELAPHLDFPVNSLPKGIPNPFGPIERPGSQSLVFSPRQSTESYGSLDYYSGSSHCDTFFLDYSAEKGFYDVCSQLEPIPKVHIQVQNRHGHVLTIEQETIERLNHNSLSVGESPLDLNNCRDPELAAIDPSGQIYRSHFLSEFALAIHEHVFLQPVVNLGFGEGCLMYGMPNLPPPPPPSPTPSAFAAITVDIASPGPPLSDRLVTPLTPTRSGFELERRILLPFRQMMNINGATFITYHESSPYLNQVIQHPLFESVQWPTEDQMAVEGFLSPERSEIEMREEEVFGQRLQEALVAPPMLSRQEWTAKVNYGN